jgi:hypothetical protein
MNRIVAGRVAGGVFFKTRKGNNMEMIIQQNSRESDLAVQAFVGSAREALGAIIAAGKKLNNAINELPGIMRLRIKDDHENLPLRELLHKDYLEAVERMGSNKERLNHVIAWHVMLDWLTAPEHVKEATELRLQQLTELRLQH